MTVRVLSPLGSAVVSLPHPGGPFPRDLSLLGAHYEHCKGSKGRWFTVECAVEALDSFVAPRFVTTLFVFGVVVGLGAILF